MTAEDVHDTIFKVGIMIESVEIIAEIIVLLVVTAILLKRG